MNFGLGCAPEGWDNLLTAMKEKGFTPDELVRAGLAVYGKKGTGAYDKFRNRLMFPIMDVRGEVTGFSGRALEEGQEPKYLNSPETLAFDKRRSLYGIQRAKNSRRGSFLLVEGNLDVVTLHQAGFDNAVAPMGTALTTEQTRLISRYAKEIILCYDNDPAGRKATERALNFLASVGAEYLDQCQVDATLLEEQETTYNDGLLDTVKGRRIWVITFDPEKPDAVNGGKCEVKMLATGPIVQYTVPDLIIMYMTGTLPDADGISRSEILAIGKEELSTLLSTPEEDLLNLKVYFGFINSRDEVATHAGYGQRVWAVHYPPQAYVLMDPDGKVLYAGKYDLASIVK